MDILNILNDLNIKGLEKSNIELWEEHHNKNKFFNSKFFFECS